MNSQRKLDEDTLRRQLTSAAQLIDPRPPTRDELNTLYRRPRRGHRALRMSPPLLVAAAVAAIAVAATAVAVQHRSEPRPPATHLPGPTTPPPTTPAGPPSTATSPNHPSRQATTTHPVSTPPASPTSPSTAATAATTPPGVRQLVRGPYGFSIPTGWHAQPLTNYGGSGSWASFTRDPATALLRAPAAYSVVYSISASAGLLYTQDGKPVLPEAVNYSLCPVAHWQAISASAVSFTCAPVSGMQPQGVLIVEPHYGGTKQVIVTLPADDQATATDILNSFH